MSGQIEDEKHFLLKCRMYEEMRRHMYDTIMRNTNNTYKLMQLNDEQRWQILMNSQNKTEINEPLKEYVKKAMIRRSQL